MAPIATLAFCKQISNTGRWRLGKFLGYMLHKCFLIMHILVFRGFSQFLRREAKTAILQKEFPQDSQLVSYYYTVRRNIGNWKQLCHYMTNGLYQHHNFGGEEGQLIITEKHLNKRWSRSLFGRPRPERQIRSLWNLVWTSYFGREVVSCIHQEVPTVSVCLSVRHMPVLCQNAKRVQFSSHLSKVLNFSLPHLHLAPPLGWPGSNFAMIL